MATRNQLDPTQLATTDYLQFPCFRTIEEEGVVRSEDERNLRHCLFDRAVLPGKEIVRLCSQRKSTCASYGLAACGA